MSDFSFTQKKGMTIAKAWMLFIMLLFVYLLMGVYKGFTAPEEAKAGASLNDPILVYINLAGVIIAAIIGFYINKKEIPFFNKFTLKTLLLAIIIGILIRFISTIIEELPFGFIDSKVAEKLYQLDYLLIMLPSLFMIILQIGIIGHGLLRNYDFIPALTTSCLLSLIYLEPKSILAMALLTGVLLFFYYKTRSFELVIVATLTYLLFDLLFLDIDIITNNIYRYKIIQNDTLYFGLWAAALIVLVLLMRNMSQLKPFPWKRKQEVVKY